MSSVSPKLVERLVCAKYIYRRGCEVLDGSTPFAAGIAVLNFQDSVEMVLRVIAEHLQVSLSSHIAFAQIIDKIDEEAGEVGIDRISHRSALNQLNNTRVNFKHYAVQPDLGEARKFKNDLDAFFPKALNNFLNLDYEDISLVDLIGHRRTANWLHKAEKHLSQAEYPEVCACSAVGFHLYRKYREDRSLWDSRNRDRLDRELKLDYRMGSSDSEPSKAVSKLSRLVDDRLDELKSLIDLLYDGVDSLSYRRFSRYTPDVAISAASTVLRPDFEEDGSLNSWYLDNLPEITPEVATFCYRFATDTVLQIQEQPIPPEYNLERPEVKFVVDAETQILVHPENSEYIRMAEEGEVLKSRDYLKRKDTDTHIAILYQGELAYVAKSALKNALPWSEN